jgi:hypothetical protein
MIALSCVFLKDMVVPYDYIMILLLIIVYLIDAEWKERKMLKEGVFMLRR